MIYSTRDAGAAALVGLAIQEFQNLPTRQRARIFKLLDLVLLHIDRLTHAQRARVAKKCKPYEGDYSVIDAVVEVEYEDILLGKELVPSSFHGDSYGPPRKAPLVAHRTLDGRVVVD